MVNYIEVLRAELKPALGCTEPAAIALAVARAKEILGKPAERIKLSVSGNILKNAMGVGIPGTDMHGIQVAAALSVIAGKSGYGLEVLSDVCPEDVVMARELAQKITVELADTDERLYIQARVESENEWAEVIIAGSHTNFMSTSKNGVKIDTDFEECEKLVGDDQKMTLGGIWNFATTCSAKDLEFLQDTIDMNKRIADEGILKDYGMGLGRAMLKGTQGDCRKTDLATYIGAVTAAAADARMSGCSLPVMSTAGSGNQGLTASLPVIAAAEKLETTRETLLRALALSQLITIHIKRHIGKLSALCGCAIASCTGAACALTYMQGGGKSEIYCAIQNMVADISGLICDGAKETCSLKIATAISGAVQCALLANRGIAATEKDGIVECDAQKSINNLARLGAEGMVETDKVILDMMIAK